MKIYFEIVLTIILVIFVPVIFKLLKAKIAEQENNNTKVIVESLVEAAEQLLKKTDPTGEKRKEFVLRQLQELGIEPNGYIDALVEQAVINLNLWEYVPSSNTVVDHEPEEEV